MICWLALGTNLGDRRAALEAAARSILERAVLLRASPVYETPALLPPGAPPAWRKPYLNAALEIDWTGNPRELLGFLKAIEAQMGRGPGERWAPRPIDLDILRFGELSLLEPGLSIPHPELAHRQFVLAPLKALGASWRIPACGRSVLELSRSLPAPLPLWMGILNFSPDSFSGTLAGREELPLPEEAHVFDLGAESTRPGATPLAPEEEWERLARPLQALRERFRGKVFRPALSIDTYHPETAERALELGADWLNDVSGLQDPRMLELAQSSRCQLVVMHSLGVPADPGKTLPSGEDPLLVLQRWGESTLERLYRAGIAADRVMLDPGIGFGKSAAQSWDILRGVQRLLQLPCRILVGHSRKSFLSALQERAAAERDPETLGVSLRLADAGVDVLRVHDPALHLRAFRAGRELS